MKKIALITSVAIIAIGGWVYATPYIAVNNIKNSAEKKDYATLEAQIDFKTLRANFKEKMQALIIRGLEAKSGTEQDKAMSEFGQIIVESLIDPLVNNLITPQTISALVRGETPNEGLNNVGENVAKQSGAAADEVISNSTLEEQKDEATNNTEGKKPNSENNLVNAKADIKFNMEYAGLNKFVITVNDANKVGSDIRLILFREGIATWKVKDIELPALDKIGLNSSEEPKKVITSDVIPASIAPQDGSATPAVIQPMNQKVTVTPNEANQNDVDQNSITQPTDTQ